MEVAAAMVVVEAEIVAGAMRGGTVTMTGTEEEGAGGGAGPGVPAGRGPGAGETGGVGAPRGTVGGRPPPRGAAAPRIAGTQDLPRPGGRRRGAGAGVEQ